MGLRNASGDVDLPAGRSGTTLLRLMLDSHPFLTIPPETHTLPLASRECSAAADPWEAFINVVTSFETWTDFHLDAGQLQQAIKEIVPFDLSECYRTFYRLYAESIGKSRWGDKTPDYIDSMALIQEVLPEAYFIHIIRDGRDVALSIRDLWWGPNSIEEAAEWWAGKIRRARRQALALCNYMEVRYEDLVADPERQLRDICDFISLEWSSDMLSYYLQAEQRLSEFDRARTASSGERLITVEELRSIHSRTNSPPLRDRSQRWRREMSSGDRNTFERVAGGVLMALGYQVN